MSEIFIEKIKNELLEHNSGLQKYFDKTFPKKAPTTIKNDLVALKYFFNIINCYTPSKITKAHITTYNKDEGVSSRSKAQYNIKVRALLKSYNKKTLAALVKDAKIRLKELDKTTLISKADLKKILSVCSIKRKALIMTNYEGALRNGELIGIRAENITFYSTYVEIYIDKSKTTSRNITLVEALPYLKEYLAKVHFEADERIFPYAVNSLPSIYKEIFKNTKKKYPEWKKNQKKFNPHLLRHSKLTELAVNNVMSEAVIRRFAGWSKKSDMPAVYFHIDDTDTRNAILKQLNIEPTTPKIIETIKTIKCEACNEPNGEGMLRCWSCGHILGETDLSNLTNRIKELEYQVAYFRTFYKAELKEITEGIKDGSVVLKVIKPE